jgi:hypothetical protein
MPTNTVSSADQVLLEIVSGPAPSTIPEVLATMQAIDAALPADDGLKWFNRLYAMVTQQVDVDASAGAWKNPQWLVALDVVFARYYFAALRGYLAGTGLPSSWNALFEARFQPGIDRILYAVAGMNAHINRDLALALNDTSAALGVTPAPNGPEHSDYQAINPLLDGTMPKALAMLAADPLGEVAEDTGKIGRVLAFWNICRARDLAWDFAAHLRSLPAPCHPAAIDAQDVLTGAFGRAILAL